MHWQGTPRGAAGARCAGGRRCSACSAWLPRIRMGSASVLRLQLRSHWAFPCERSTLRCCPTCASARGPPASSWTSASEPSGPRGQPGWSCRRQGPAWASWSWIWTSRAAGYVPSVQPVCDCPMDCRGCGSPSRSATLVRKGPRPSRCPTPSCVSSWTSRTASWARGVRQRCGCLQRLRSWALGCSAAPSVIVEHARWHYLRVCTSSSLT
mmetsp:Transcript_98541/g.303762  ORF Transcript_98541/g.303762 Transcript_98541/m.303762 type:complete len:210 (+) Transcript_98541:81-710(+)